MRASVDAGANAAVLPALSVASLVGFGAVVAALPAFALVRDWVLGLGGGPLVSLAVATNVLSALTGSASGGLTIALDALGPTYMRLAAEHGIDPALLHRVAVIGAGTLDSLPHNGAVVTLLAVCGSTPRQELFRHRHGGHRRCALGAGRRHRAREPARIVLNQGAHLDPAPPCFGHRPGGRFCTRSRLRHSPAWPGSAVVRNGARPAAGHCQCPLLRRRRSRPDARRGCSCPRARAGGVARRRPADQADAAGVLSRVVRRQRQRRLRRRPHQRLDHHGHAARSSGS